MTDVVNQPQGPTEDDVRHAGNDARQLAEQSSVIRTGLTLEVAAQQLSFLGQKLLHDEIAQGWEVQNPGLVFHTLLMSARNRAAKPCTPRELLTLLVESVVPIADTICRMNEGVTNVATATGTETVCGTADDGPPGVGEVLCGAEGGRPSDGPCEDPNGHGEEADGAGG